MSCVSWARSHWVQALSFVITSILLIFIAKITWDTLVIDHPFESRDTKANIRIDSAGNVVFQYWCEMHTKAMTHARAARFIAHTPSGKVMDFGTSERIYEAKITPVYREFVLGPAATVEKGEWCFSATMFYQPDFSIKTHYYQTPRTCAHVH